jgi:hypothetical protein
MAIAVWDHAVSSGVMGPRPANSSRYVSPPTTPSRASGPSVPLHADNFTPSSAHNVTDSCETRRSRPHNAGPVTPVVPTSSGRSVGLSSPSSHGSATRLASIICALNELGLESREPFYVVLRGLSPGVYASRCVSAHII